MQLHPIDPRDGTQEVDEPDYRVYFRRADGATEEWRLTHVEDVLEVIQWAQILERRPDVAMSWA